MTMQLKRPFQIEGDDSVMQTTGIAYDSDIAYDSVYSYDGYDTTLNTSSAITNKHLRMKVEADESTSMDIESNESMKLQANLLK